MIEELARKIYDGNVILFVGAGVSATLKMPTWRQLIDYMAKDLEIDPEIFSLYGDALQLAEYYVLEKGNIGKLRSWMDKEWNVPDRNIRKSPIYKKIVQLGFKIIYTTNYDRCIERAFDIFGNAYTEIVKVENIPLIRQDQTQIIKFHGDFSDDSSIVLTESSYFERMDFETPLDIKLRSDILGKSLLFLGYSMSDINMRYMIYKLNKMWGGSSGIQPKSYIFMPTPNLVQEKILKSRNIVPVIGDKVDASDSLDAFLGELLEKTKIY